jgi:hypothetical protein
MGTDEAAVTGSHKQGPLRRNPYAHLSKAIERSERPIDLRCAQRGREERLDVVLAEPCRAWVRRKDHQEAGQGAETSEKTSTKQRVWSTHNVAKAALKEVDYTSVSYSSTMRSYVGAMRSARVSECRAEQSRDPPSMRIHNYRGLLPRKLADRAWADKDHPPRPNGAHWLDGKVDTRQRFIGLGEYQPAFCQRISYL